MNHQEQNREALIRHIADLEAVIRRRNEQIDNQAHNARETQRALEEIAHERDEARGALRARLGVLAEHRPLTPDAITDEAMRRAVKAWEETGELRPAIFAAITAPARPEGAEEMADDMEDCLRDVKLEDVGLDGLADRLAAMGYRKDVN